MSFDYSKLRGRIIEKYGSVRGFSEHTRIGYPAVIRKMAGETKFSQEDIMEWCNLLEIELVDVPLFFLNESSNA